MKKRKHPKNQAVIVDKKTAAAHQLESAISIWFAEGDPISMHTLAVAAHDCIHALAKHKGDKGAFLRNWLVSQPKAFRVRVSEAQNFFKHGFNNLTGKVRLPLSYTEYLMLDSVECYGRLFGDRTPVMELYSSRYRMENPNVDQLAEIVPTGIAPASLADISRIEFFERFYPILVQLAEGPDDKRIGP